MSHSCVAANTLCELHLSLIPCFFGLCSHRGIEISIQKGVLERIEPPKYTQIEVLGKTADQVADEIIASLGPDFKGG